MSMYPAGRLTGAMKISAARQRNAVSKGLALGLGMLERYEF